MELEESPQIRNHRRAEMVEKDLIFRPRSGGPQPHKRQIQSNLRKMSGWRRQSVPAGVDGGKNSFYRQRWVQHPWNHHGNSAHATQTITGASETTFNLFCATTWRKRNILVSPLGHAHILHTLVQVEQKRTGPPEVSSFSSRYQHATFHLRS